MGHCKIVDSSWPRERSSSSWTWGKGYRKENGWKPKAHSVPFRILPGVMPVPKKQGCYDSFSSFLRHCALAPLFQPVLTIVRHFSYIVSKIHLCERGLEADQCWQNCFCRKGYRNFLVAWWFEFWAFTAVVSSVAGWGTEIL